MAAGHRIDTGEADVDFSEACRAGDVTVVRELLAAVDGDSHTAVTSRDRHAPLSTPPP